MNPEQIPFEMSQSRAFAGPHFAQGPELPLAHVGGSAPSNSNDVTIVFDQPVQPGSTVTVALQSTQNPSRGGVYLFGVTAYPVGTSTLGQFLGYSRVQIYDNSN